MVDTEFYEFRKRIIIAVIVIIIFSIPLFIFVINNYGYKGSKVLDKLNNKEDMVLLLRNTSCDYCSNITDLLDSNNIDYEVIMVNTDDRYNDIVRVLDIPKNDVLVPELVEVIDGKADNFVVDIQNDNAVLEFISYLNNKVLDER